MNEFKSILAISDQDVLDGAVVDRATTLAGQCQARLTVAAIVEPLPREFVHLANLMLPEGAEEFVRREREDELVHAVGPLRNGGREVEIRVLIGEPVAEIGHEVLRSGHDLVVLGDPSRYGIRERLFGTPAVQLIRKCPCAVWLVKGEWHQRCRRILAAVDPDPMDDQRHALNTRIMDVAVSLAEAEKSEIHVVHVWTAVEENLRMDRGGAAGDEADTYVLEGWGAHRKRLDALLKSRPLEDLQHRVHLVRGQPASEISRVARHRDVDLVVVGRPCRRGIARVFGGDTAERILPQVDCPVLIVKPEDVLSGVGL